MIAVIVSMALSVEDCSSEQLGLNKKIRVRNIFPPVDNSVTQILA